MIEAALRDKVLPADFRFPMTDARLALARCARLDGRTTRRAVVAPGPHGAGRPGRAAAARDRGLRRGARCTGGRGDLDAARPLLDAAVDQFARLGMTGWLRRAKAAGVDPRRASSVSRAQTRVRRQGDTEGPDSVTESA